MKNEERAEWSPQNATWYLLWYYVAPLARALVGLMEPVPGGPVFMGLESL